MLSSARRHQSLVFTASSVATFGALPSVIRVLRRSRIIDSPNDRSSHVNPTPRGGGLACVAGVLSAATVSKLAKRPLSNSIVFPSLALATVGFVDDAMSLPAAPRLGAQVAIGFASGFVSGGWPGAAAGTFVTPAVVNCVNFMDGVNGISAATLAGWGAVVGSRAGGEYLRGLDSIGPVATGVAAGFAPWNVPSARVFLGDSGSYLFGGLVASSCLRATFEDGRIAVTRGLFVLAPLTYYFADTGVTLLLRLARRERLTEAHRDHFYQRIAAQHGVEHWHVAVGAGVLSLLGGFTAMALRNGRD